MIAALALAVAGAMQSAAPPPPEAVQAAAHSPTDAELGGALEALGFSKAGIALIQEEHRAEAQMVEAEHGALDASFSALTAAARAVPFDDAVFERLFRSRQQASSALQERLLQARFAMFHRLPVADRARFADSMLMTQTSF